MNSTVATRLFNATVLLLLAGSASAQGLPRSQNPNLKHLGYYFSNSKYGDYSSEVLYTNLYVAIPDGVAVSDDPDWQPRLHTALQQATDAGQSVYLILLTRHAGGSGAQEISWDAILDVAAPFWDHVAYIEVKEDQENLSMTELENRISGAGGLLDRLVARGLSRKPIGAIFTASTILNTDAIYAPGLDFVSIEAFLDGPGDADPQVNIAILNNYLDAAKARVRGAGKTAVLVMMGYDRTPSPVQWTNIGNLAALQAPVYLQAYNDPMVAAITIFSYGRPGGTREHPELASIHQAVSDAMGLLPPCNYAITPPSINISSPAADGTLYVTTQTYCSWSASSDAEFLTFANATNRVGSGSLLFNVSENHGSARTGSATVAGLPFVVTQSAACAYSLSPQSASLGPQESSGPIQVITQAGCPWNIVTGAGLTFDVNEGIGPSVASYTTPANISVLPRSLTATVAGQTFTVTQAAAAADAALVARDRARADFNTDGRNDLLWQDTSTGYLAYWLFNNDHTTWTPQSIDQRVLDMNWRIVGTGDFNADGKPDIVWRHQLTGSLFLWYMDGPVRTGWSYFSLDGISDTRWTVVGVGDFNGDNKPDLVWQHDTGWLAVWLMDGATLIGGVDLTPGRVLDTRWRISGVADLNADGKSDLVFRHEASGELAGWLMDGTTRVGYVPFSPGAIVDLNWRLAAITDLDGDQAPDFVWHHATNGGVVIWWMNGTIRSGAIQLPVATQPQWKLAGPR